MPWRARIRRILERFGYEDVRVLLTLLRRLTRIYEEESHAAGQVRPNV